MQNIKIFDIVLAKAIQWQYDLVLQCPFGIFKQKAPGTTVPLMYSVWISYIRLKLYRPLSRLSVLHGKLILMENRPTQTLLAHSCLSIGNCVYKKINNKKK